MLARIARIRCQRTSREQRKLSDDRVIIDAIYSRVWGFSGRDLVRTSHRLDFPLTNLSKFCEKFGELATEKNSRLLAQLFFTEFG
jgi:hypothetical protein